MEKIIIFGLQNEPNLGDNVIGVCTEWLVNRACKELGYKNVQIASVDMLGRTSKMSYENVSKNSSNSRIKFVMKTIVPQFLIDALNRCRNNVSDWKNSFAVRSRTREIASNNIDDNTKAIIFAGGGIIKYKTQEFYLLIDEITKIAEEKAIPVMFNAVGVEGFDIFSSKCRILKNALNRSCVKFITTRDDYILLKEKYIDSKNCFVKQMADSAFWSDVVYRENISQNKESMIGLSVARDGLFSDHGIPIKSNDLIYFWKEVTNQLDKMGMKWKFLCNGTFLDYQFLEKLLNEPEFRNRKKDIALPRATSGEELIKQLSQFEGVIACRLHAGIISYSLGIPEIMLIWNEKQIKFSEFIQYPERCVTYNDFTAENAVNKLKIAMSEGYPIYNKKLCREETFLTIKEFLSRSI